MTVSCRRYTKVSDGVRVMQEPAVVNRVHHELTVWSRGIIMDKEARDVSTCIATAARRLGYHAENVSDYVDDPDRTNCLVRRYARFADEPILDRFVWRDEAAVDAERTPPARTPRSATRTPTGRARSSASTGPTGRTTSCPTGARSS